MLAEANPQPTKRAVATANFSRSTGVNLLVYWRIPRRAVSSKGFCKYLYLESIPVSSVVPSHTGSKTYLRRSLLNTSTIFLTSGTSTGSLADPMTEKVDFAEPSSKNPPPGANNPPTRRISKNSCSYLR